MVRGPLSDQWLIILAGLTLNNETLSCEYNGKARRIVGATRQDVVDNLQ